MQRHVNAELHFGEKPVQRSIHCWVRYRLDYPGCAIAVLAKGELGQRRRELMIFQRKLHGLAETRAAENGKAVHTVS
jgi:hypothetical protein